MTLPLFGTAALCRGLEEQTRSVVRLKTVDNEVSNPEADFTIVRTSDDLKRAIQNDHKSIFAIDDGTGRFMSFGDLQRRTIAVPAQFSYLAAGDVIGIHTQSGKFRTLYRHNSRHNSFLVTERCNNYCLMCSQPPKNIDDRWILNEIRQSLPLLDKHTRTLTFTGGEPLSDWADFISILADCRDQLPETAVQVLTNGRAFAKSEIVDAWKKVNHPSLIAAIPVYAAVDYVHDYVVQAKGAFDETILGILKLKDRGQRVEVRVVLHAQTARIISDTCRWLARNLPFVDHVALMGLENTGFAIANDAQLWIDPIDYQTDLAEAVDLLVAANVNVSVYNLQRCVLAPSVWPHAVQSISDWKNAFVAECEPCTEKTRCAGFFSSGRPRRSKAISPIL
ncbi:His-Xaa-Ser system radical SAM maturase HxsC [Bradyrhizobium sp. RDM4]|uniref:His-Xaa-Ser system radical SAM maturase HxsC n=1 Tax=Bradyrhizobium sp. RDM4 TaxID=3378765 RepID=UPI0038FCECDF